MGRESVVACMATSFMSGASCAPMENSPPGIHAIPCGDGAGTGVVLGMVGPKTETSAASIIRWPASTLLVGERCDERRTEKVAAAATTIKTVAIHTGRAGVEVARAACVVLRLFCCMVRSANPRVCRPQLMGCQTVRVSRVVNNCQIHQPKQARLAE